MNSKMDTQREKAFFENLKSHQVTSENEMKLIKFCMISTKLFSGDSSWWLEPCVCRNFSLCARDRATHTHVFHTDTHMCTQHLQIHPQLNCSRFHECQQHEGCLPLPLPHISLPLSLSLSITLSLSIALSLSPSLAHSLCNSLSFFCLRCWESSFILFCFFPLLWIFVSISWWEKSPADFAILFLVFSSFSLSLAMSPGSKHWTSHSASLWIRHFLCISPLLRGTGTRLSPLSLPLPLRLLHLYLLCFTSHPLAS